ncbi:MAG: hypothetical protein IPI60_15775 [Saprospiraceae bacterium]|nr:hypothetical protein [Saprospiraceae bacterium]
MTNSKFLSGLMMLVLAASMLMSSSCKKDDPDPESYVYNLQVKDQLGITGNVTFTKKSATVTTITIRVNGASAKSHPAHIHANSIAEGGPIVLSLNDVSASGTSVTDVTMLDDNSAITYEQLINFDGYLNVHESATELGIIVAQADIGGNELTATSKSYNLAAVNASGVNGTALFQKRKDNSTMVTLTMTGLISGTQYPANIHLGSVESIGGGPVRRALNNIDGTTGKSVTNISSLDDNTAITYDNWLLYDGYIAVRSAVLNPVVISQGNIGSNSN